MLLLLPCMTPNKVAGSDSWKAPACSNAAIKLLTDNQRSCYAVCAESFSSMYGYCMAIAAPGFGLATLGLGPSEVHWWGYLLLWTACSSTIAALMYNKLSKTGLGYASRSPSLCACPCVGCHFLSALHLLNLICPVSLVDSHQMLSRLVHIHNTSITCRVSCKNYMSCKVMPLSIAGVS